MKVIHILPHAIEPFWFSHPGKNTYDHHIIRFANRLAQHARKQKLPLDQEIYTLTVRSQPYTLQTESGITVRLFPRTLALPLPLEFSWPLIKHVWGVAADKSLLWHVHAYYLWMYDWIAPTLWLRKCRFFAHYRGGAFTLKALPYSIYHYILALPFTLRMAHQIFVQNKTEVQRLQRWYRLAPDRLVYLPNCITQPVQRKQRSGNTVTLAYVGRLIPLKGIIEAVTLVSALKNEGMDVVLKLAGDGPLRPTVEAYLENHPDMRGTIELLGAIPQESVYNLLQETDIFLFGNRKGEGSPQALIEAQAVGVPAVSFNRFGINDVIVHGETGYLVETWDQFRDTVGRLVRDRAKIESMSQQARERTLATFSCDQLIGQVLDAYQDRA